MAARNYSALLGGERLSRNVGKEVYAAYYVISISK